MSALTDYVHDLIYQAYIDGDSGNVPSASLRYLTEEQAADFIADELESGAYDEWIHEYLLGFAEPALAAPIRMIAVKPDPSLGFDIPYDLPRGVHPALKAPTCICQYNESGNSYVPCQVHPQ